jgi:hypothetical protein
MQPDTFVRLQYGDIGNAHFQLDKEDASQVINSSIELAQPAELFSFFGIDTSDARAILRFAIPDKSRADVFLCKRALERRLHFEEEKLEAEVTAPRKIRRTDYRTSLGVHATGAHAAAATPDVPQALAVAPLVSV